MFPDLSRARAGFYLEEGKGNIDTAIRLYREYPTMGTGARTSDFDAHSKGKSRTTRGTTKATRGTTRGTTKATRGTTKATRETTKATRGTTKATRGTTKGVDPKFTVLSYNVCSGTTKGGYKNSSTKEYDEKCKRKSSDIANNKCEENIWNIITNHPFTFVGIQEVILIFLIE